MEFKELEIEGVWLGKSLVHSDSRGWFREWFKPAEFKSKTGIVFETFQSNCSTSQENVVRGLHFSNSIGGQAKLVTCVQGSVMDVVVDLRKGSTTFLKSVQIELSSMNGNSIYIPTGFGHGFRSLEPNSVIVYNLTSEYQPASEFTVNIFDESLDIGWDKSNSFLSQRDHEAPPLNELLELLPNY
jgi:dTDP-4-dehydrorhamnose 3,5-epimerase